MKQARKDVLIVKFFWIGRVHTVRVATMFSEPDLEELQGEDGWC